MPGVTLWCMLCLLLPLSARLEKVSSILGPAQVVAWHGDELKLLETPSLTHLRGPIGTVCITGDDRVGKSTLLTLWGRDAARSESFAFTAGHNRSSHTQGLWAAILPTEATGLKYHLSLCDSQGLKQVGELSQWRLFSANVLIPSVLVYMVINVVQNDQLRDLARMAHQFLQLSSEELNRFGGSLSPHLVVVVRDESDFDGEGANDLGAHLEAALSGSAYAKDKELIKKVFKTREAWSLRELPRSARQQFRHAGASQPVNLGGDEARQWRASGLAVFQRVQQALAQRIHTLPQSGTDLVEWYRNVLETVNSHEDRSMGRLIGHSERLAATRQRRYVLEEWWSPLFAAFLATAFFGLSDVVGRWLDRVACFAWMAMCVFYVGASPLLITPLHGVIPRLCEEVVGATGGFLARRACQEASAQTVAILLAAALGLLTYPVLTARLRWLLELLPIPYRWQRIGTACVLATFMNVAWALSSIDLNELVEADEFCSLFSRAFLIIVIVISGTESLVIVQRNRSEVDRSHMGRELHNYVAARVAEVAQLEDSDAWRAHFRLHGQQNSLWRHRLKSCWHSAALFLQACGLLAWAQLLSPHCDLVLAAGTLTTSLQLLWRCLDMARDLCCPDRLSSCTSWCEGLEDASGDEFEVEGDTAQDGELESPPIIEESEEEVALRLEIERMRQMQDPYHAFCRSRSRTDSPRTEKRSAPRPDVARRKREASVARRERSASAALSMEEVGVVSEQVDVSRSRWAFARWFALMLGLATCCGCTMDFTPLGAAVGKACLASLSEVRYNLLQTVAGSK